MKTGHLRNIDCLYFYSENNNSCRQKIILLATAFASAMLCKKKYRAHSFGTAYGLVANFSQLMIILRSCTISILLIIFCEMLYNFFNLFAVFVALNIIRLCSFGFLITEFVTYRVKIVCTIVK